MNVPESVKIAKRDTFRKNFEERYALSAVLDDNYRAGKYAESIAFENYRSDVILNNSMRKEGLHFIMVRTTKEGEETLNGVTRPKYRSTVSGRSYLFIVAFICLIQMSYATMQSRYVVAPNVQQSLFTAIAEQFWIIWNSIMEALSNPVIGQVWAGVQTVSVAIITVLVLLRVWAFLHLFTYRLAKGISTGFDWLLIAILVNTWTAFLLPFFAYHWLFRERIESKVVSPIDVIAPKNLKVMVSTDTTATPESLVAGAYPPQYPPSRKDLPRSQVVLWLYHNNNSDTPFVLCNGVRARIGSNDGLIIPIHAANALRSQDRWCISSCRDEDRKALIYKRDSIRILARSPYSDLVYVELPARVWSVLAVGVATVASPKTKTAAVRAYTHASMGAGGVGPTITGYQVQWGQMKLIPKTSRIGWKHYLNTAPSDSGTPLYAQSSTDMVLGIHLAGGPTFINQEGVRVAEHNYAAVPTDWLFVSKINGAQPETPHSKESHHDEQYEYDHRYDDRRAEERADHWDDIADQYADRFDYQYEDKSYSAGTEAADNGNDEFGARVHVWSNTKLKGPSWADADDWEADAYYFKLKEKPNPESLNSGRGLSEARKLSTVKRSSDISVPSETTSGTLKKKPSVNSQKLGEPVSTSTAVAQKASTGKVKTSPNPHSSMIKVRSDGGGQGVDPGLKESPSSTSVPSINKPTGDELTDALKELSRMQSEMSKMFTRLSKLGGTSIVTAPGNQKQNPSSNGSSKSHKTQQRDITAVAATKHESQADSQKTASCSPEQKPSK
jgi:hypothetical protein